MKKMSINALQRVRALAQSAREDHQRTHGKPLREFGNDTQRKQLEQVQSILWRQVVAAGGTPEEADGVLRNGIVGASTIANRDAKDTPAPTDTPKGESES